MMARTEVLGEDDKWRNRIINIAGNHDIGYAGDLTQERMERFEKEFGAANWEMWFELPRNTSADEHIWNTPEIRIVVLNSLNLDTPAISEPLQTQTYNFLNKVITDSHPVERDNHFTLLLTHLPLHKREGVCVDAPFFSFHDSEYGGGVKEQNHLSDLASRSILEGLFGFNKDKDAPGGGMGRKGLIVTGHDHEGCDVYHHLFQDGQGDKEGWQAEKWNQAYKDDVVGKDRVPGVREITLRSMMGEFAGYAGLISISYNETAGDWDAEFATCSLGIQHIWWAVHILDFITLAGIALFIILWLSRPRNARTKRQVSDVRRGKGRKTGFDTTTGRINVGGVGTIDSRNVGNRNGSLRSGRKK
jgi:hypothetical protein